MVPCKEVHNVKYYLIFLFTLSLFITTNTYGQIALADPGLVYASTEGSDGGWFFSVDPITGEGTIIGATGLLDVDAIAINSQGEIYGTYGGSLYRIDAESGTAIFISNPGLSTIRALAFNSSDELYVTSTNRNLYTVDPNSGAYNEIGDIGSGDLALAFDPTNGTLWGNIGNGIVTVNTATAARTYIGNINLVSDNSTSILAFDGAGNLYAVMLDYNNYNSHLIFINKTTLAATTIGNIGFTSVSGLAFYGPSIINSYPRISADNSLNFGITIADSVKTEQLTIYNNGADSSLQITDISSSSNDFSVNQVTASVLAGDSTEITVTFTPTEMRAYNDSLTIFSNDPYNPQVQVYLYGRGDNISFSPGQNELNVNREADIEVTFGYDINPTTLNDNTFVVYSLQTGKYSGTLSYNSETRTVTFDPDNLFIPGEVINVTASNRIQTLIGDPIDAVNWQFTIETLGGSSIFNEVSNINTNSYSYSIVSADFNGDGNIDLAVPDATTNVVSILRNNGNSVFTQISSINAGNYPTRITKADFDGDGDVDLAIGTSIQYGHNSVGILILINDGTANFTHTSTANVIYPNSIIPGDFDGDGDTDLAVSSDSSRVTILDNNGSGIFSRAFTIAIEELNSSLLNSADFDGDGDTDLVIAGDSYGEGNNSIIILENNGNGSFTHSGIIANSAYGLTSADFDGDGDVDIASGNSILLNNGNGIFLKTSTFSWSHGVLSSADFDGDGDLDLISPIYYNDNVLILRNDGNANFTNTSVYSTGNGPYSLTHGDFNSDGKLDIATANLYGYSVSILENLDPSSEISINTSSLDFGILKSNYSKSSSFTIYNIGAIDPLMINSISSSSPSVYSIDTTSATINSNDSLEIVVTFSPNAVGIYSDSISIFSNDTDEPVVTINLNGIGAPVVSSTFPVSNAQSVNPETNISASFNNSMQNSTIQESSFRAFGELSGRHKGTIFYNDGLWQVSLSPAQNFIYGERVQAVLTEDIVSNPALIPLIDGFSWDFLINPLFGSGYFLADTLYAAASPFAIASGEFNDPTQNVNYPDLVAANNGENSVTVFINDENGAFNNSGTYNVGSAPQGVVVADVDADGYTDIITANNGSSNISVLENQGNGTFANAVNFITGASPRAIAASDLDNDGDLDIVTGSLTADQITILFNNGSGSFGNRLDISVGAEPTGLVLQDFDSDGNVDIAVCNKSSNTISVLLQRESLFTIDSNYTVGSAPYGLVSFDFDNDGDLDLATANGTSNDISVLYNNSNGTFSNLTNFAAGNLPIALYGNDLDGDADIDLAVAHFNSGNVIIYHNDGTGSFIPADTIAAGTNPRAITGLDISGQWGIMDLAVTSLTLQGISILKNQLPDESFINISTATSGEQSGDIDVNYAIYNLDSSAVSLRCEYKFMSDETWQLATISGDTSQLAPANYNGTIVWNSGSDLANIDEMEIQFKMTTFSGGNGNSDSITIHIDNFHDHTVAIELTETLAIYRDTISVNYTITDTTWDVHSLQMHYRVENSSWEEATTVQNTSAIDSTDYINRVEWLSRADLPGINPTNVRVSAVINDNWQDSEGDTTDIFVLNNNIPPSIVLDNSLEAQEQSADIDIGYQLSDSENDTLHLAANYSIDNGQSWQAASVSGMVSQITSANYNDSFTWHSVNDLPATDSNNVILKVQPSDLVLGESDSVTLHLDNNQPPAVHIVEKSGEQNYYITFQTILTDTESDLLSVICSYRLAGEDTWHSSTISGSIDDLLPGSEEIPITWESFTDIPTFSGYLWFRVTPFDNDPGVADSIYILVDNLGVPVIVELSQPVGEQNSDISFNYLILDDEADLINLSAQYSLDSLNWVSATITGATSSIDTFNYSGNLVWNSSTDLPGLDIPHVWFRLIPADANTGVAFTTSSFHLDNNEIPTITIGTIDTVSAGNIQVAYTIQDSENDTIELELEFSLNGVDWNTSSGMTVLPGNYQDTFDWNSITDLGIGIYDIITLRITPSDNDTGSTQQTNLFKVINYAGDFSGDININFQDLLPFAVAWNAPEQDLTKEIGPATGEPPLLTPQPDGVIDFLDLMVLVRQWNWSFDNGPFLGKSSLFKEPPGESVSFNFSTLHKKSKVLEYELNVEKSIQSELNLYANSENKLLTLEQSEYDPWQNLFADQLTISFDSSVSVMAFSFEIIYDQQVITIANLENFFLAERNGFSFKNMDQANGTIYISSAVLDQGKIFQLNNDAILKLNIEAKKEQKTFVLLNSKIYNEQGSVVSSGQNNFEITIYDRLPQKYALFQNYPNPFNPSTTIRYQLPEAGKVNLEIFNVLGQRVASLVNKQQQAGYYQIAYNIKDLTATLASGIYVLHLRAKGESGKRFIKNIKMVLLK